MSFFDPQDKANKPILDYFENKIWLVVDASASTRTSIKKSVAQLGAKLSNMLDADNFADAKELVETKKPHFIIGHQTISGGKLTSLYSSHVKGQTNRLNAGFFILTEEENVSDIAAELEYEMDGIITLPFTALAVIDTVLEGSKHKISPSSYVSKVEEGRSFYLTGNFDKATELFNSALYLHEHPYEAYFFLGQIYNDRNLIEKAIGSYEESLAHNNEYFRTLKNLSGLYLKTKNYKKAYDINFLMAQKYPILTERIPELIRLSIINKKYEDINNYLKVFKEMKTSNVDTQLSISAGLAVLGKYFIHHNDKVKGVEALKAAYSFCNGKYEILDNIMNSFEACSCLHVLLELFDSTDLSMWSDSVQGLYFHTLHHVSRDDAQVLFIGEQLLKKKVKDPHIYVGLIERGIKMHRKIGNIEGLVLEAIKIFPEKKEEFEKLLESAKAQSA